MGLQSCFLRAFPAIIEPESPAQGCNDEFLVDDYFSVHRLFLRSSRVEIL